MISKKKSLQASHADFSVSFRWTPSRDNGPAEANGLPEVHGPRGHCTPCPHPFGAPDCTIRVRAFFKSNDDVVPTIKAATIKNEDRKNDFCEPGMPSPPVSVITRWASWLRAALFYTENLPSVRTIVNNWTGA